MSRRAIWRVLLGVGILLISLLTTIQAVDTAPMPPNPQQQDTNHVVIPYSGRLTDPAGGAVADGKYDLLFGLYDDSAAGTLLWTEEQDGVTTVNGTVTLLLGAKQPLPSELLGTEGRWLAVAVRGPGETEFAALEPRQALLSTAPAASIANTSPCAHDHTGESWAAGAANGLQVSSTAGYGLYGRSTDYIGVYGSSTNHWSGWFDNGIRVSNSAWHGIEINSTAWAGVWVENAGFAGVEATGAKGDGVLGITKDVDNAGKAGVHGYATGGLFRGVVGQDGSGTDASWGLMTLGYPNPTDNNGDAFIQDDLVVNGSCSGCATAFLAKNGDAEALTPGVVVMITGVGELDPRLSGQRPLLLVQAAGATAAATAGSPLLGVVLEGAPPKVGTGIAGNGTTRELIPSGGYLVVATPGQLVQMNVAATAGAVAVGDALTVGTAGGAVKASSAPAALETNAAPAVLGRALEPLAAGQSKIWVMLTFR